MKKIKVWPNGLGFDWGKWECMQAHDGSWMVRKFASKEDRLPCMFGTGTTYIEAIVGARKTDF